MNYRAIFLLISRYIVLIGFAIGLNVQAIAQNKTLAYPSKPITMIVPFPPGGATDAIARIVAQRLTVILGQSVVVENHPGAGGVIGAGLAAHASSDGYTLLFTSSSTHSIAPSFTKKLPYDTQTDFTPIGGGVVSPALLTVTKTLPINTLKELIVYAKAHPGELNFASSGNGTVIQLNAEALKADAGIEMVHVPYKGSALALPDLISGKVHLIFDVMIASLQPVKDGKLTALGVGSLKRSPLLPNVPTIAEAGKDFGLGHFESSTWFGLFGPKNLSSDIVNILNSALNKAIISPDVVERFAQLGAEPIPGTPEKFATMVAVERVRWSKLIKQAQITSE